MKRLQDYFEDGQEQYAKGQMAKNAKWYRTPIWKGGIDLFTLNRIVGSVVLSCVPGGAAFALALNAACIAVDMADGVVDVSQGFMQIGVAVGTAVLSAVSYGAANAVMGVTAQTVNTLSTAATVAHTAISMTGGLLANTFAAGIQYGQDGSIGWDWKGVERAAKGSVMRLAVSCATTAVGSGFGIAGTSQDPRAYDHVSSGLTQGFMSGYDTRGNIWDFSWDYSHTAEHLTSGLAAGLSSWTNAGIKGIRGDNAGSSILQDAFGGTAHMNMISSGAIHSGLMSGMYNLLDGEGFRKENNYGYQGINSEFDWNSMTFDHRDIGSLAGNYIGTALQKGIESWAQGMRDQAAMRERYEKADREGTLMKEGSIDYYEKKKALGYELTEQEQADYDDKMMNSISRIRVLYVMETYGILDDLKANSKAYLIYDTLMNGKEAIEKNVNYKQGKGLLTNEQVKEKVQLEQNIKDCFINDFKETTERKIQQLKDKGYDTTEIRNWVEEKRKSPIEKATSTSIYNSLNDEQKDLFQLITDPIGYSWKHIKSALGGTERMSPGEIQNLTFGELYQGKNGPAQKAITTALKYFGYSEEDANSLASTLRSQVCATNALYGDLKINNAQGMPSLSGFYIDHRGLDKEGKTKGLSNSFGITDKDRIISQYKDSQGKQLERAYVSSYAQFEKILNNKKINSGIVRVFTGNYNENNKEIRHSINIYNNYGNYFTSDVGHRWRHGKIWSRYITQDNFRHFEYLKHK
jgi:hypothetical protein